jgi:hypothetical protein
MKRSIIIGTVGQNIRQAIGFTISEQNDLNFFEAEYGELGHEL